jgi:SpoVK/Ycf46/Vps4 family AAA+-type ATPase
MANINKNSLIEKNYLTIESSKKLFTLSSFLSCLDGHIISEGNIIIMTTNHVELIDPACIRPGRMDVHLELGYCTYYQLNKLYKNIINISDLSEYILKNIPEKLLPPCEVMTLFTLYNKDQENVVINKLNELVIKYKTENESLNNNGDKILMKKKKIKGKF